MAVPFEDFEPVGPLPPIFDSAFAARLEDAARAPFRAPIPDGPNDMGFALPELPAVTRFVTPRVGQSLTDLGLDLIDASTTGGRAGAVASRSPRTRRPATVTRDPEHNVDARRTTATGSKTPPPSATATVRRPEIKPRTATPAAPVRMPRRVDASANRAGPSPTNGKGPHGNPLTHPAARMGLALLGLDHLVKESAALTSGRFANDPEGFLRAWRDVQDTAVAIAPPGAKAAAKKTCLDCRDKHSKEIEQNRDAMVAKLLDGSADFYAGLATAHEEAGNKNAAARAKASVAKLRKTRDRIAPKSTPPTEGAPKASSENGATPVSNVKPNSDGGGATINDPATTTGNATPLPNADGEAKQPPLHPSAREWRRKIRANVERSAQSRLRNATRGAQLPALLNRIEQISRISDPAARKRALADLEKKLFRSEVNLPSPGRFTHFQVARRKVRQRLTTSMAKAVESKNPAEAFLNLYTRRDIAREAAQKGADADYKAWSRANAKATAVDRVRVGLEFARRHGAWPSGLGDAWTHLTRRQSHHGKYAFANPTALIAALTSVEAWLKKNPHLEKAIPPEMRQSAYVLAKLTNERDLALNPATTVTEKRRLLRRTFRLVDGIQSEARRGVLGDIADFIPGISETKAGIETIIALERMHSALERGDDAGAKKYAAEASLALLGITPFVGKLKGVARRIPGVEALRKKLEVVALKGAKAGRRLFRRTRADTPPSTPDGKLPTNSPQPKDAQDDAHSGTTPFSNDKPDTKSARPVDQGSGQSDRDRVARHRGIDPDERPNGTRVSDWLETRTDAELKKYVANLKRDISRLKRTRDPASSGDLSRTIGNYGEALVYQTLRKKLGEAGFRITVQRRHHVDELDRTRIIDLFIEKGRKQTNSEVKSNSARRTKKQIEADKFIPASITIHVDTNTGIMVVKETDNRVNGRLLRLIKRTLKHGSKGQI